MMLFSASILLLPLFLFFPHLSLSSEAEERDIVPEALQFIQRVPCSEPQNRCSFKDFAELRGEKNFLDDWMVVLYFEFDKYSSHDVILDIVTSTFHVKLFRHKVLVGRVLCDSGPVMVTSKICRDKDPSVIYLFENGRKTDYWWTVTDLMNSRAFVLGNLLTARYTEVMETAKHAWFDEETKESWLEDPDTRKYMLVVHLVKSELKVNATDRVRAFDFLGVVSQTIPNVRIMIIVGAINKHVEFWWFDSRWCPDLSDPTNGPQPAPCQQHRVDLDDLAEKDADELLCEIEKFSAGLNIDDAQVNLLPNSAPSLSRESSHRLLMACPFFFLKAEGESSEDIRRIMDRVPSGPNKFVSVIGDQKLALSILISHGADLEKAKGKIIVKYHSDIINNTNTDIFSRMTSPAGCAVEISSLQRVTHPKVVFEVLEHTFKNLHFTVDYEGLNTEYSPYQETDELSLILASSKRSSSHKLQELSEKEFKRRTGSGQPPTAILFFVQWSPASLIARNLVFPSASNELASRFNLTDRLFGVDCFNWNELCQREGIEQYPTVKFFFKGSSKRLETVLSLAEILRETVMLDLPPLLEAKAPEEVERALNVSALLMDHAVLGVGLEDVQVLEEFRKAASTFKGKAFLILTRHQDLPQKLQARIPDRSLASFSARLRPDLFTTELPLRTGLEQFVSEARFDRVMELTWVLFQEFQATKRPLLVLLVLEMIPKLECLLSNIAVLRRGQYHVTWLRVTHNSAFPIFKDVKEPTAVVLQAGSIHRWVVKSFAEDETGCARVSQELDHWLKTIKEGNNPANEFVKDREYPPEGLHINVVDDVYPHHKPLESEMMSTETNTKVTFPEETEEDIDYSDIEATALPKPSPVHGSRDEL